MEELPEPDVLCDCGVDYYSPQKVADLLKAERERCAKLCEGLHISFMNNSEIHDEFQFCADAIRNQP